MLWTGGPADGRFEIEYLSVHEVDEAGLVTAIIFFDVDDARAAQREAWARWAAIDPVAAPWVELRARSPTAWNAAIGRGSAPSSPTTSSSRITGATGIGRIEGRDAYVDSIDALWELAPDRGSRSAGPGPRSSGTASSPSSSGTARSPTAAPSRASYLWLVLATGGRITRLELFDDAQVDAALARFAELRA